MEENKISVNPDLSKIHDENEYADYYSAHPFTHVENPVVDSEGYIRSKNEPTIKRSLVTRDNKGNYVNVTTIESKDLVKVQNDYKRLEDKFDSMMSAFTMMMSEIRELKNTVNAQTQQISEQTKTIVELSNNLKAAEYRIETQENQLALQIAINANNEKQLNTQTIKGEAQEKIIRDQNEKIVNLEKFANIVNEREVKPQLRKRKKQKRYTDDENSVHESDLETVPLVTDDWMGREHSALKGMRDTFSIFTPSSVLSQEKQENALRKASFDGDDKRVEKLLSRNKNLVNGRGMPDSLCSIANSFSDKTSLMLASQKGHLNCVNLLLENGAEINYLDRDNFTALDYATQKFHKGIADCLKKKGAVHGYDVIASIKRKEVENVVDSFEMIEDTKPSKPSYKVSFN